MVCRVLYNNSFSNTENSRKNCREALLQPNQRWLSVTAIVLCFRCLNFLLIAFLSVCWPVAGPQLFDSFAIEVPTDIAAPMTNFWSFVESKIWQFKISEQSFPEGEASTSWNRPPIFVYFYSEALQGNQRWAEKPCTAVNHMTDVLCSLHAV